MPGSIDPALPVAPYGGEADHLRRLAATIPGMLYDYVLNPDGSSKFLYVGSKCRELLELNEQELLADAGLFWELIVAEDLQRLKSEDVAANQEGESFSAEVRIRTRSGCLKWIQLSSRPNPALPGELVVWSGFMLDITERKQAEAELAQYRDHLEELVSARTSELLQSRDAAEAGNRAKTTFLANMSHELRTPMNGVIGMIDLALRRATDSKQIDWLNKSKGAALRMSEVVNDILDFSKIEAERLPLEEKNFSLSQLIDEAIAMHDLTAEAKGLILTREISATLPSQLSGDAFRLRQILLNFLGNACKFSDQGTITVRVSAVEQDDGSVLVRIEVEDQGVGISAEKQAKLFRAFSQVDDSMSRKYGGSGLGLVICKRLANLMGGDVGVLSQEGRGSTFWVTVRFRPAKTGEAGV
jgi:PAS domain S-box-containing protein